MEIYRGDIFWVKRADNQRAIGSEMYNERPAVVVSNEKCNKYSPTVEIVYLTTKEKNPLPTHVQVITNVPSTALCEQIFSVNRDRLTDYIRSATTEEMAAIDEALMISLGMNESFVPNTEVEKLKDKIKELENRSVATVTNAVLTDKDSQVANIMFERDFYKQKYEELFAKVVG